MRAIITEDKGLQRVINLEHVKMIEFTKSAIRIIWKDARADALTVKAKPNITVIRRDKKWRNLFWFEVTEDDFNTIEKQMELILR